MTPIKKNERFIPIKNYIIVAILLIGVIGLTVYAFCWHKVIKENRLSTSYLIESKTVTNEIQGLENLDDVFSEAPSDYYLYISYTGSEDIYNAEKDMASLINKYQIGENVYYLNVNSIKNDNNYIDKINETLGLDDEKITNVPVILYYKDGKLVDLISKDGNNIIDIGSFQKLLEENKVEKDQ